METEILEGTLSTAPFRSPLDLRLLPLGDQLTLGDTFHPVKNLVDYLANLIVQEVRRVSGRTVTLDLLFCLTVANIPNSLGI